MMRYGPGGNLAAYAEEQKKRGRKTDAHTVKRVAQAFRPYRFQVALVLTAILLTTLLGLVNPILIAHVFDDAILKGDDTLLLIYVAIMIIVPIGSGFIGVGQNYLNNKVGQRVMADFRNQLYQHLQSMPLRFFTGTRTGEIQSRLSNDVSGVQGVVTNTATSLVANISAALSIIIAMAFLSPLLTLISLSLLPLFLWITYKVGNIRRKMSKETQKSLATLSSLMQETLSVSGILLVKVFGQQQYAQNQFKQENEKLAELAVQQSIVGRWFFMIIGIFFAIIPALIYLVAGSQIIHHATVLGGTMTLGTIIAFSALQGRLFFPIGQLLSIQVEIQGALALFDRIFEYLDMPNDITDKTDAFQIKPEMVQGDVTFRNVTFTYKRDELWALADSSKEEIQDKGKKKRPVPPKRDSPHSAPLEEPRPVLKNISFTIKPGQLAALVGPSGAGKTTITYMVPRLYDVESGAIEIDGINVKDIAQTSLSKLMGVVTQETYLFHASIRENLLYARPDATEEEIIAAAQAAAIHDRVMELEDGYDTIVGERGYKLSGGEKQRVAIARVILKNPRILILDEATSSLDTHSERLVQASLETLMKGRTTLAIAHRLSTILAADVILVVNKGEIVERGTHQELLALEGLYAQLYHEQFSRLPEAEAYGNSARPPSDIPSIRQAAPIVETQAAYLPAAETVMSMNGILSEQQAVSIFEREMPYQQGLAQGKEISPLPTPMAMPRKTASPTEQAQAQTTSAIPALSTRHLPPVVREIFRPSNEKKPGPSIQIVRLVAPVKPRLIITASFLNEKYEVLLESDTITLGEADSNDIVLSKDYMVAPYHALLKKQDGGYHLFERYSQRGVFINGRQLVLGLGYKLTDGDQIMIGHYHLVFSNTSTQNQTKPTVSASHAKRVTLPKMLTLPAKRRS